MDIHIFAYQIKHINFYERIKQLEKSSYIKLFVVNLS